MSIINIDMSESSDKKDLHVIERLAANLVNRSEEVRDRSATSLLLKLDLKIIPRPTLLSHYHYIVGRCLECLNEHLASLKSRTMLDLIQILNHFAQCQEGRDILRRYGSVEFMSELLEYISKEKNGAIAEQVENFLRAFYQTGKFPVSETKNKTQSQLIMEQGKVLESGNGSLDRMPKKYGRPALPFKRILEDLDNELDFGELLIFRMKILGLAESEKTFLIELTTQLRFTEKKEIRLGSALGGKLLTAIRAFPFEIYFGQFSDLFIETLKLAAETSDRHLAAGLLVQVIDSFARQAKTNRRIGSESLLADEGTALPKPFKASETFLETVYPPLKDHKADHDNLFRQKLSLSNIIELLFRSFAAVAAEDGLTALLGEKFIALIEFLVGQVNSVDSRKALTRLLARVAEFYEVVLLGSTDTQTTIDIGVTVSLSVSRLLLKLFMAVYGLHANLRQTEKPYQGIRFDFGRFVTWAAEGLFSLDELKDLHALMNEADAQAAKELGQFERLQESVGTLLDLQEAESLPSGKPTDLAVHVNRASAYGSSIKALFAVQGDLLPLIETFAIIKHVVTRPEHAHTLSPDQLASFREYISGFIQFCEIVLFTQDCNQARTRLLDSLKTVIKGDRRVKMHSGPSAKLQSPPLIVSEALVAALHTTDLLNLTIISCLEREPQCSLHETQVFELLAEIFAFTAEVDSACDPYLLANLLASCAGSSKPAHSLQSFLSTRSPWFAKLSATVQLASKDVFSSYQNFYILALGAQNDRSSFNTENGLVQPKITKNHPYFGLLDETGQTRVLRSELEVLAGLASSSNGFLTPSDLKDLHDILAISTNEAIDVEIRKGALQQIFEATISMRNNREARDFSASVANLAFERLFKCELGPLTDVYIKILLAFLLHHSFNASLKLRMLENLRGLCKATEFRPLTRLLETCLTSPDRQFKLNCLALTQLAVSSPTSWETRFFARFSSQQNARVQTTQRLLQTLTEDSIVTEADGDSLKFAFLKFNRGSLHNFYGGKARAFGARVLALIGCSPTIVGKVLPSGDLASVKEHIVIRLIEDRLRSAKNLCLSNSSSLDPTISVAQLVSVTLIYRTLADFVSDTVRRKNLIAAIQAFHREILPRIAGLAFDKSTLRTFSAALADLSLAVTNFGLGLRANAKNSKDEFFDFAMMAIGPALDSKSFADKDSSDILCAALLIWAQNAPALTSQLFAHEEKLSNFASRPFSADASKLALETLSVRQWQLRDPQAISSMNGLLQKCAASFTSHSGFLDLALKSSFLFSVREVYSLCDPGSLVCNFDYYLRAKELIKSSQTELRLRAWSVIFTLSRRLDSRSVQNLSAEILFKCNEHLGGFTDFEHPAVNDQILSVVICLLSKQAMQGQEDGPFHLEIWKDLLKKLARKARRFTMAGLAGLLVLARTIDGGQNPSHESPLAPAYEHIAEHLLLFQNIEKVEQGKLIDSETEENTTRMISHANLGSSSWLRERYAISHTKLDYQQNEDAPAWPGLVPLPFMSAMLRYLSAYESVNSASFNAPSMSKLANEQLSAITRELHSSVESMLLLLHELLGASNIGIASIQNDDQTREKAPRHPRLPSFLAGRLAQAFQFLSAPFLHSIAFPNSTLLESVLARLSTFIPRMPGASEPDLIRLTLSLSRLLDVYAFKDSRFEESCLSAACFVIKRLRGSSVDFNVDLFTSNQKPISAILITKMAQRIGQVPGRVWAHRQPLAWILASSAHAKRTFLASTLPSLLQRELGSLGAELAGSESDRADKLLAILRNLFFPLPSSKYTLIKTTTARVNGTSTIPLSVKEAELFSQTELEGLKAVYLTLAKAFTAGADAPVYDVLTNWHLNKAFSSFPETLAVKGKHFVLDKSVEIAKQSRTLRESEFILALRFLRSIASVDFAANYIVKARLPFALAARMNQLYLADKRDQLIALNLKAVTGVVDFFLALSFNRTTHLKLLEGGKEHFEVFKYFYTQTKDGGLLRKFEVLFTNLVMTKTTKAMFLEWPELVRRMQKTLVLSGEIEQQLLASQFFYNLVYKDASATGMIDKKEFARELELISSESITAIDRGDTPKNVARLALLLKNIRTVRDILLAV